jgi:hypothetical protein
MEMNRRVVTLGFGFALAHALWAQGLSAQTFSITGVAGPPNVIFAPGLAALYPPGPPFVEVDEFEFMSPVFAPDGVLFSVSPGSMGLPGSAVAAQFAMAPGEQIADLYFTAIPGPPTNVILFDGNGSTPPGLGLIEPGVHDIDGVDGAALPPPPPATVVFFTVNPATAAGAYLPASAADVFSGPAAAPYSFPGGFPAPVYAPAGVLGLVPGDDIDGLDYMEDGVPGPTPGDVVYLSLAPGSPTLGLLGASAADILIKAPTVPGPPAVFLPAVALGLAPGDNIDGLSMHMPGAGVPVELSRFSID